MHKASQVHKWKRFKARFGHQCRRWFTIYQLKSSIQVIQIGCCTVEEQIIFILGFMTKDLWFRLLAALQWSTKIMQTQIHNFNMGWALHSHLSWQYMITPRQTVNTWHVYLLSFICRAVTSSKMDRKTKERPCARLLRFSKDHVWKVLTN